MLEDLIAEVNGRGLRINNLFQLENGGWQSNITDGERFWEFGRGDTPTAALLAAMQKTVTSTPVKGMKSTASVTPRISTDLTGITL